MKCSIKKPIPAARNIEIPIINRPEVIPSYLNAISIVIYKQYYAKRLLRNCLKYLNQPNLLLIVKSSKNIDVIEIKEPNIISGLDFSGVL
tara:strand:+ start:216 stop:485 length:270 start_codon:yes stop_codon:yes gene_type:complete